MGDAVTMIPFLQSYDGSCTDGLTSSACPTRTQHAACIRIHNLMEPNQRRLCRACQPAALCRHCDVTYGPYAAAPHISHIIGVIYVGRCPLTPMRTDSPLPVRRTHVAR